MRSLLALLSLAAALAGISLAQCQKTVVNPVTGKLDCVSTPSGGSMVYPAVGLAVSTGVAWGASVAEVDGSILLGAAGAWTAASALPNGITAATQSPGDNSTKVATTQYVDSGLAGKATSKDAFGAFTGLMPNATFPKAYALNSAAGDIDLYTVGTNRKALITNIFIANFGGNSVTWLPEIKVSGSYTAIGNGTTTTTSTNGLYVSAGWNAFPSLILNAGETISVNTSAAGGSFFAAVVEFDASSPLSTKRLLTLASGANTLYTVPASTTFEVLGMISNGTASKVGIPVVYYYNGSGASRNVSVNAVPNAGSPGTANQIFANATAATATVFGANLPGNLAPGDFINITTDAATATQVAWVNVIEH